MGFTRLGCLFLVALPRLASAEFYSDVDSKEHDEAKALEIKAKDFWQGLMDSADGLETSDNARLCAEVDKALESLPPQDNDIREHFHAAIGHLATADAMLFEEASSFKKLALQRLENGPAKESFFDIVAEYQDSFYTAVTQFIGYKTYENRLAKHVISRIKDMEPAIDRAADLAPQMIAESSKASTEARAVLRSRDGPKQNLPIDLRRLAMKIISATGKQRLRFSTYLLNSVMTTAEDIAGKDEEATKTVMKSSLQSLGLDANSAKTAAQSEAKPGEIGYGLINDDSIPTKVAGLSGSGIPSGLIRMSPPEVSTVKEPMGLTDDDKENSGLMRKESVYAKPTVSSEPQKTKVPTTNQDIEPPLVFFDGVPIDAEPVGEYASQTEQVLDV